MYSNRNTYYYGGATNNSASERSICATSDLYNPTDDRYPSILIKKLK